jgi:hypothetical protein
MKWNVMCFLDDLCLVAFVLAIFLLQVLRQQDRSPQRESNCGCCRAVDLVLRFQRSRLDEWCKTCNSSLVPHFRMNAWACSSPSRPVGNFSGSSSPGPPSACFPADCFAPNDSRSDRSCLSSRVAQTARDLPVAFSGTQETKRLIRR